MSRYILLHYQSVKGDPVYMAGYSMPAIIIVLAQFAGVLMVYLFQSVQEKSYLHCRYRLANTCKRYITKRYTIGKGRVYPLAEITAG
jgi:hypothetical protein